MDDKNESLVSIFLIVPRAKGEKAVEMLTKMGVNFSYSCPGRGTAPTQLTSLFGVGDTDKTIVTAIVTEGRKGELLDAFCENFTKKAGESVAFSVPLSSIGGSSVYSFVKGTREENV